MSIQEARRVVEVPFALQEDLDSMFTGNRIRFAIEDMLVEAAHRDDVVPFVVVRVFRATSAEIPKSERLVRAFGRLVVDVPRYAASANDERSHFRPRLLEKQSQILALIAERPAWRAERFRCTKLQVRPGAIMGYSSRRFSLREDGG
jgi:hypothetical protein